jgi:hypothetical protein
MKTLRFCPIRLGGKVERDVWGEETSKVRRRREKSSFWRSRTTVDWNSA